MATAAIKPYPPIPYGVADFRAIRREGFLYVDKTRFVRELEGDRYAFLLRPRRFGKTCWLSMLEHYYDRTRKDGFEALFAGTEIGCEPTGKRSGYAVLRLNFSAFGKRLETLEERFEEYCHTRVDYAKLRHLVVVNRDATAAAARAADVEAPAGGEPPRRVSNSAELRDAKALGLNGNFDVLRQVIAEGRLDSDLCPSFPMEQLGQRENFATLLRCFGLLSIRGAVDGRLRLGVPNQTVRQLMYGYLRDAYRDVGVFSVDLLAFENLIWAMARDGEWRPAVDYLAAAVRRQTSVRDYVQGERLLQGFLAAYLGATSCFVFHTGQELGKGYADMVLAPLTTRYPSLRRGYVVELKYLKRGSKASARSALAAAKDQLRGYLADERLTRQHPTVRFTGLALVFSGWELAAAEAVDAPSAAPI